MQCRCRCNVGMDVDPDNQVGYALARLLIVQSLTDRHKSIRQKLLTVPPAHRRSELRVKSQIRRLPDVLAYQLRTMFWSSLLLLCISHAFSSLPKRNLSPRNGHLDSTWSPRQA